MNSAPRIYLDNAATSWPKPDSVVAAVQRYLTELGAPAGRSAYAEAAQAGQLVAMTRSRVAKLLAAEEPTCIVFAFNGTDALNIAIHGLLRPGDRVVTTAIEHNSVLRPLRELSEAGVITIERVSCDRQGFVDPGDVARAVNRPTRLVAISHASNVTGAIQSIREIADLVHRRGAVLLVDAAQTLGHVPTSVVDLGADLLAAPGHKGLLGPQGTGVLYIRRGLADELRSTRQGGTGTQSDEDRQPESLPYKFEAGSHNLAGLAGLAAGVEFLQLKGIATLRQHDARLARQMIDGLAEISGVTLHGPTDVERRVGVVSVSLARYDPQEAAATLDATFRVQVRAGLHCAPHMHAALGTLPRGGTVRFSLGVFNTESDVEAAIRAVRDMLS